MACNKLLVLFYMIGNIVGDSLFIPCRVGVTWVHGLQSIRTPGMDMHAPWCHTILASGWLGKG